MKVTKSGNSPFFEKFLSKLAALPTETPEIPIGEPGELAAMPAPETDITSHPPESESHLDVDSRIAHALDQLDRAISKLPDQNNPVVQVGDMGLNLKGLRDLLTDLQGPPQVQEEPVEPEIKTPW